MDANRYVINPETGRQIRVEGVRFYQLIGERYDYFNGELVRRANAPPPGPRHYYFNTITHRRVTAGGRRYYELLNAGWDIENDYYLVPPSNEAQDPLPTYERIMAIHREKLANLNITLCRECFIAINLEQGEYCDECIPPPSRSNCSKPEICS